MVPTKPSVLPAWAENGDKAQPINADIQTGWPLSNIPPSRQRFNWILNYLSNAVRYFSRRGLSDYDAAETYMTGDRVIGDDGKSYRSLADNNIANTPSTTPAKWERWGFNIADIGGLFQTQLTTAFTSAGVAPAFTLTPNPAPIALAANQRFRIKFHAAGTTGNNTLNISTLGAVNLKQYDSTGAKVPAVVTAGMLTDVEYDGVDMVLLDSLPLLVAEAATQSAEDALFASGCKIVVRTDLLPPPPSVPDAPTIGIATGGNASASVAFTAPVNNGGSAITGYTVTSTPGGITATGTSSPINVSGLANLTNYTFTVHATNAQGNSAESAASNIAHPAVPANIQVLLHMDGANGGIAFTDSAGGAVVTVVGGAVTTVGAQKFGSAFGNFSTAGSYLSLVDAAALRFAANDWTIECWHKMATALPANEHRIIVSKGEALNVNNGWYFGILTGGNICFSPGGNATGILKPYAYANDILNWHHLSLNCVKGIVTLFVDGVAVGFCQPASGGIPAIYESPQPLIVGSWYYQPTVNHADYLDDFILSIGAALRTNNFTPPTTQVYL